MNKRRGKHRFNVIDVLLLILIIVSVAAIAFLVYRNNKNDAAEEELKKVKIMYTLENKEIDDILRGKIDIGNALFTPDGTVKLGEVVDVEYSNSEYTGFDSEKNEPYTAVLPGRLDMRVVISADAVVDNDGIYYINGVRMNTGKELDARFSSYTGKCVCVSVSEVNE